MAKLSTEQRQAASRAIQGELSRRGIEIPVGAGAVDFLVGAVDDELETAESNVVSGLPDGAGKTWLQNNASIGREIMAYVETKRKDVL